MARMQLLTGETNESSPIITSTGIRQRCIVPPISIRHSYSPKEEEEEEEEEEYDPVSFRARHYANCGSTLIPRFSTILKEKFFFAKGKIERGENRSIEDSRFFERDKEVKFLRL